MFVIFVEMFVAWEMWLVKDINNIRCVTVCKVRKTAISAKKWIGKASHDSQRCECRHALCLRHKITRLHGIHGGWLISNSCDRSSRTFHANSDPLPGGRVFAARHIFIAFLRSTVILFFFCLSLSLFLHHNRVRNGFMRFACVNTCPARRGRTEPENIPTFGSTSQRVHPRNFGSKNIIAQEKPRKRGSRGKNNKKAKKNIRLQDGSQGRLSGYGSRILLPAAGTC